MTLNQTLAVQVTEIQCVQDGSAASVWCRDDLLRKWALPDATMHKPTTGGHWKSDGGALLISKEERMNKSPFKSTFNAVRCKSFSSSSGLLIIMQMLDAPGCNIRGHDRTLGFSSHVWADVDKWCMISYFYLRCGVVELKNVIMQY